MTAQRVIFKEGQKIKTLEGGKPGTVVEVKPIGLMIMYRIEFEDGHQSWWPGRYLRERV